MIRTNEVKAIWDWWKEFKDDEALKDLITFKRQTLLKCLASLNKDVFKAEEFVLALETENKILLKRILRIHGIA